MLPIPHRASGKEAVLTGLLACAWFAACAVYVTWDAATHRFYSVAIACAAASLCLIAGAEFFRRLVWPRERKPEPTGDRPTPIE